MKPRFLFLLVVCLLLATPAAHSLTLREVGEAIPDQIELSLVAGSPGLAAGLYWPLVDIEKAAVTIGPFFVAGDNLTAVGVGVKLPLFIPIAENFVDFVAFGPTYKHGSWHGEIWVGKSIPIR